MDECLISIIMPTYNSERTIKESLQSIRSQTIDQSKVEILLVDGGSTDNTLQIAASFAVKVIKNKKRLPEPAKQLGLLTAQGKYGIFIDSDEAFSSMDSLQRRVDFMEKHSEVKNLVSSGQICVEGEKGINRYANYIGDPFSNFMYRYNGYNRIEDLTKQYKYEKIGDIILLHFGKDDTLPLFDALGNMFDLDYAKRLYGKDKANKSFAANIFSNMVKETGTAAVMEDDYIYHQPGLTSGKYLEKLKWRVKNNLFQDEGVGYRERSKSESKLKKRQYLYIPYCVCILPVVADAVRMSVKNRDLYFMIHILYADYVMFVIVWYMLLKILHYPVKLDKTYGKEIEKLDEKQ